MQDFCFARKVFGEDFVYEKHVNYLLKSLKKSTSSTPSEIAEAHRLSVLFFLVSGLDLLGALDTRLSTSEKEDIIEWIYSYNVDISKVKLTAANTNSTDKTCPSDNCEENLCQIDESNQEKRVGHSGFRATSMIDSDIPLDCGNLSMTYCALACLVILGDDLKRVNRQSIIEGMKLLQLPDGSFKPSILGGESDMRLVYCAASVCQLLDDWSGMDKESCARFIKNSLSYEGAFAQCPGAEAHGGSTYCALASLKLMSKLEETMNDTEIDRLIRWCINRIDNGFSGRPNKDQDTCYSFWIGACLVILDHFKYIEQKKLLEFILLAQEERGGLGKVPAFYSDPLHTYLGIAGLTFVDEELCASRRIFLLRLDPTLNISMRARRHLARLHESWRRGTSLSPEPAPKIVCKNDKSNGLSREDGMNGDEIR